MVMVISALSSFRHMLRPSDRPASGGPVPLPLGSWDAYDTRTTPRQSLAPLSLCGFFLPVYASSRTVGVAQHRASNQCPFDPLRSTLEPFPGDGDDSATAGKRVADRTPDRRADTHIFASLIFGPRRAKHEPRSSHGSHPWPVRGSTSWDWTWEEGAGAGAGAGAERAAWPDGPVRAALRPKGSRAGGKSLKGRSSVT